MSPKTHDTTDSCRLHRFEKNRYFQGKLMTARDMEAEQQYNVGRQKTLTRHVSGEGLLCGLSVTAVEEADDMLEVTIEPGVALDCCGNPIVVKNSTTQELDPPGGDELYIHLRYDECSKETVPIPGSENACDQECAYNRVLEIFELDYEETPPDDKHVPPITYPTPADLSADEADARSMMARSYYDAEHSDCASCDQPSVFLGAFERADDSDTWTETSGADRRPFVYTNDMLYATIAGHVTDFGNPHDVVTTLNDVLHDGGNVDLVSEDESVLVDPGPEDSEVNLAASAESVGALVSVDGVENPGGDIALESSDGLVDITPDDGGNSIDLTVPDLATLRTDVETHQSDTDNPHEVTAAQVGAVESLEGVTGDADGNVDLTSPDDTVAISTEPATVGDNAVGLSVSGVADLEERMADLEDRFGETIDRLTERVTRLEHHVMERSVLCICNSFGTLGQFEIETAQEIVERVEEFLEQFGTEDRIEPESYLEFMEELLELEVQLMDDLQETRLGDSPRFERLEKSVEELEIALDESEDDVLPVATAQERVCMTVRCLGTPT